MIEEPVVERDADDTEHGVVVRGVTRDFGLHHVLKGLDLTVPYGRVTALVGPNGAGKTTLMLILATLLQPTAGTVRVAGFDPAVDPIAVRRLMGWMPDVFGVYDQLTVREYLDFFADAYQLPKSEKTPAVQRLLARVRLDEFSDRPVSVLSRGQKQRLGLARALVHQPRVLLLDEPASGLDPRSRIELRDILRGLAAEGVAILVSSHLLSELSEIADRAVFVSDGLAVAAHDMAELASVAPEDTVGWRIRSRDPLRLDEVLAELEVAVASRSAAGVEIAAMTEEGAAALLKDLVTRDVPVVGFGPLGTPLENAYLALTEEQR